MFPQITELSKEVFRLKEALGALSPPLGITTSSSSSSSPPSNPGQQMALQNRISILAQQLQVRGGCPQRCLKEKNMMPESPGFRAFKHFLVTGLGEKAQTGCGYISLSSPGGCAGEVDGHKTDISLRVCH